MTTPTKINLLHLWSVHHPRDFVRRVEELLNELYERVEKLEAVTNPVAKSPREANKPR